MLNLWSTFAVVPLSLSSPLLHNLCHRSERHVLRSGCEGEKWVERPARGGSKGQNRVEIIWERGGSKTNKGGVERGCCKGWRARVCVSLSLSLFLSWGWFVIRKNNNLITSAEPLLASICEWEIYAERGRQQGVQEGINKKREMCGVCRQNVHGHSAA